MSHSLTCGCTLCARLLAESNGEDFPVADATQEDLLCDPCREGVCAGAMRYNPDPLLAHARRVLLGENEGS